MVEKNCKACGDLIVVRLADHKRGWGNFCDKRCKAAHSQGERPGSINAYHTSCVTGGWAFDQYHYFQRTYPDGKPPVAKSIKEQVGQKVKIKKVVRPVDDRDDFEIDHEGGGWDAHKNIY